jgi:hypothetical protein
LLLVERGWSVHWFLHSNHSLTRVPHVHHQQDDATLWQPGILVHAPYKPKAFTVFNKNPKLVIIGDELHLA